MTGIIERNTPFIKRNFGNKTNKGEEEFVVDTGCSLGIVVSEDIAKKYELRMKRFETVVLADGSKEDSIVYDGWIEWFGKSEMIDTYTLPNCPDFLLGIGLLNNTEYATTIKLMGSELEIIKVDLVEEFKKALEK